jgi:Family of unknown function (DUF6084)
VAAVGPLSSGTMPRLGFAVTGARRVAHTAAPTIGFGVRIASEDGRPIRSVLLDTQIQIAARRRPYDPDAAERLFELFGATKDWGTTLRTLLWTRVTSVVPPFTGTADIELHVPCTYDLDVTASRYFEALGGDDVPLEFLFSGTVFYGDEGGALQAGRISWEQDAELRMPVAVWRETMEHHFRRSGWLRLRKDTIDRLALYRSRHALASWEDALEALLPPDEEA